MISASESLLNSNFDSLLSKSIISISILYFDNSFSNVPFKSGSWPMVTKVIFSTGSLGFSFDLWSYAL